MKQSALVPLLYWLLVVAGLAGFTLKRIDGDAKELVPIWTGTLFGVVLGQTLALKRVRAWVPVVVLLGCFWLAPAFYVALYEMFGNAAGTWVLAFLPAAVCAYLSLSERCGLVAFWYPAVLWMLVVFDGASPSTIDPRGALPIFVGLTALFAWFLRARETRRARIWLEHGNARIATPVAENVLRTSPLRAGANVAWTAFAGASALVMTAWVAPHLLQTDKSDEQTKAIAARAGHPYRGGGAGEGKPCCPARASMSERERTREYFSILRSTEGRDHDMFESDTPSWCQVCKSDTSVAAVGDGSGEAGYYGYTYGGAPGGTYAGAGEPFDLSGSAYDGAQIGAPSPYTDPYPIAATTTATPTTYEPVPTPTTTTTVTATPPAPIVPAAPPVPTTKPAVTTPVTTARPSVASQGPSTSTTPPIFDTARPSGPGIAWPSPWRSALALVFSFVTLRFLARIARRRIVLRHLADPYWNESLDQRISNHWQRMLIGLRDAGIVPKHDEQPLVFARRIGIEGATKCATILERARHGVRIDSSDVDEMNAAATSVYESARARAGVAARAAGALRWPLA